MISRKPERAFESTPEAGSSSKTSGPRESYEHRLNKILTAATEVIARDGYEKASMRTVAKAAGVSLAGLYYYFDSKEKMLFLIQFRTFSALLSAIREKLLGVDDPVNQLRVIIRVHVGYFVSNMAALKVCSHELDSLTGAAHDEVQQIRRDYYTMTRTIVGQVLERAAVPSTIDRSIATMALFGTLNWLYRWYDPKRDRSPNMLANQLAEQFLQGILGAQPNGSTANGE